MTRLNSIRALVFACAATLASTLAGCGGGGASSTSTAPGSGGGGGATTAGITVALKDPVTGAARTSVAPDSAALAEATVRNASGAPVTGVAVKFSVAAGYATFFPTSGTALTNASGVASLTIAAGTTTGADTLTAEATVGGAKLTGTTGYSTTAPSAPTSNAAGSIRFVSATPKVIAIRGAGGVNSSEVSTVVFRVSDANGSPVANQTVTFSLDTAVGGVTLSPTTATTAANGEVQTIVNSGTVATAVRVTATVVGSSPRIAAISDVLVVSTGIPHDNGFTIAADKPNIEGFNFDGETAVFTARLTDHFGNFVPDGTAVSFRTEGGVSSITPSCTTLGGACTVTLSSSGARPLDGRLTVLATAIGEETYTDANGNGIFDSGESYIDLPEAFIDGNEDSVRQVSEEFVDFNSSGTYNGADSNFNGVLRAAGLTGPTTLNVRSSLVIVLSGSSAVITSSANPIALGTCSTTGPSSKIAVTTSIKVVDARGQVMPAGTTIDVVSSNGFLISPAKITVPSTSANAVTNPAVATYGVSIEPDWTQTVAPGPTYSCTNARSSGSLTVTVTTPKNLVSTATFTVTD